MTGMQVIFDLHSHYPIYLGPRGRDLLRRGRNRARLSDVAASTVVRALGRIGNRAAPWGGPRVTADQLRAGGCAIVGSVLYCGAHEWDLLSLVRDGYGHPGPASYFAALLRQMDTVEAEVERSGQDIEVVRNMAELRSTVERERIAVVHCVEGGFHLGNSPADVESAVSTLASRGVAYITLAHLFWRSFSPNVPVLPLLSAQAYHRLFPMPSSSLPELGRVAIEQIVRTGMLLDLTHMTEVAMMEAIELIDPLVPHSDMPILASHIGYRFGRSAYNLSADSVRAITGRGGVIGIILSKRILSEGTNVRARNIHDSLEIVFKHIDRLGEIAGDLNQIAIGSDLGGFIKPLPGLGDASRLDVLGEALAGRYGEDAAERLCSGNASGAPREALAWVIVERQHGRRWISRSCHCQRWIAEHDGKGLQCRVRLVRRTRRSCRRYDQTDCGGRSSRPYSTTGAAGIG